ncbi:hypothetical protein SPBR_06204 [Sporothrix brasiliensis 5110]|uniref:Uncharacterized protein n=1 Tax=Sporothrix brasiliensis 5110 TaxID=1398154 RepID=A0A0C2IXG6_9PEZI|nr:uncharacterized protein SPBR_06204 [Sporothrix brasiliensis 5110]KIH93821.1 hypothetical protein SPBR_06204 [Sporothrix brasiliensis 5110]
MSDTSEFTVAGDFCSSPSSVSVLDSGSNQITIQNNDENSDRILLSASKKIKEMLHLIRSLILELYNESLRLSKTSIHPSDEPPRNIGSDDIDATDKKLKERSYDMVVYLIRVLKSFGDVVTILPEDGHAETAELLVSIMVELSAALVENSESQESYDGPESDDRTHIQHKGLPWKNTGTC